MNWYKSESATMPVEIDTESSKVYNYVRQNIEEVERENADGETVTMYEYDECRIPKESWGLFLETEQNTANIDYIAMETGVELEA